MLLSPLFFSSHCCFFTRTFQIAGKMGEQDIESAMQEPLVSPPAERCTYPNEKHAMGLPLARTLVIIFWGYNVFWCGASFTLDYVCTTGLRITFWTMLLVSTAFTLYSTYSIESLPLTYTFAKDNKLNALWCSTYALYQGGLVAMACFIMTVITLSCVLPIEDFLDWNCSFRNGSA